MGKRIYFYGLILMVFALSCKEKESIENSANVIINKAIEVSGGEKFKKSTISFQFRDKKYKAQRDNGLFVLERIFKDTSGIIRDELSNSGFKRFVNEELQNLPDSLADIYSNSVNSVHYFFVLPFGLNDPAVNKSYIGVATIKERQYHKIKVTFDEIGGGNDYEDVFIYWVGKDDFKLDFLAYSFRENGGGMRFRKAFNERYVNGIRFVDYDNFRPINKASDVSVLDQLFVMGKLELLSKIEMTDVKVE